MIICPFWRRPRLTSPIGLDYSTGELAKFNQCVCCLYKRKGTQVGLTSPASNQTNSSAGPERLLAVFAHPDDDVMVGPLLVHYAQRGVPVSLLIATAGDMGVTEHAKIPAGALLSAVREKEAQAAAKIYGLEELILLGEADGKLAALEGESRRLFMARLRTAIEQVKPSVVITFGPEGYTGHSDHCALCSYVTELVRDWDGVGYSPRKLYYVVFPASKSGHLREPILSAVMPVDDASVTTRVDARDGLRAAAKAERCYHSQHTPELMEELNDMLGCVLNGHIHLRLAHPCVSGMCSESDIFDAVQQGPVQGVAP